MQQIPFIDLFYWYIWICSTCFERQTRPWSGAHFDCIYSFGTTHRYCCRPVTRLRRNSVPSLTSHISSPIWYDRRFCKFHENRCGESLLYLRAQMKFYPHFSHLIPICKKISSGNVHKSPLGNSAFRENRRFDSHILIYLRGGEEGGTKFLSLVSTFTVLIWVKFCTRFVGCT